MKVLLCLCLILPVAVGRQINPFVIGGVQTDIANHPHQLSLRVSNSHSCGASLISTSRAVSAAHCAGSALADYNVLGGTTDRTVTNCSSCVLFILTAFNKHPEYINNGGSGYPNDVAVMWFDVLPTNNNFKAIVMATQSDGLYVGESCVITGWGKISAISDLQTYLQQASLTVLSNNDCSDLWSTAQINSGHICVIAPGISPCNGDSGGPLVCNGKLAGTSSWFISSCNPDSPSVYSRTSHFYDWIISQ